MGINGVQATSGIIGQGIYIGNMGPNNGLKRIIFLFVKVRASKILKGLSVGFQIFLTDIGIHRPLDQYAVNFLDHTLTSVIQRTNLLL